MTTQFVHKFSFTGLNNNTSKRVLGKDENNLQLSKCWWHSSTTKYIHQLNLQLVFNSVYCFYNMTTVYNMPNKITVTSIFNALSDMLVHYFRNIIKLTDDNIKQSIKTVNNKINHSHFIWGINCHCTALIYKYSTRSLTKLKNMYCTIKNLQSHISKHMNLISWQSSNNITTHWDPHYSSKYRNWHPDMYYKQTVLWKIILK